ncbi:glutamate 5-kinase [Jannaschia sp. CCS1]|uniref:Glutamate 5-kinase n=1 Tax=Jannaschia sp. (strain CCS1) TaxID=290400 RepID=PROB_JANSC|nr:glutamate 5-kinase [Jannaschia sp. CCS1]Q28Q11.1 RecName: Full=Glutamate 5-kinase; AltName: Full=Gamma-glutamyl kinase; Short=GK [Jannaschia sp. CCS1]ABD55201.1 glutamate 5-kinase [Jannaschia sp. CCS1]
MASLTGAKRVVVKIGSALLVDRHTGDLRADWLAALADDIAALKGAGTDVILVSSGAIALGRGVLALGDGALSLDEAQAAAAVGQIRLARAYEEVLAPLGLTSAQILLTLDDSADRRRYLNTRATFAALLARGAVPIVNENDTIATDEIRYGDNDRLAANVAVMAGADICVLLSDVDGLYTANPNDDTTAAHLPVIDTITPEIEAMAGDAGSGLSKGGMKTKVLAARTATAAGCAMAITQGAIANPLRALDDGARATWFTATVSPQQARKAWIGAMKPKGSLRLDAGAAAALSRGKSLLPAGVVAVTGDFLRGDPVRLEAPDGAAIGIGLSRYGAKEALAIQGHQSDEIPEILGYPGRAALVHRDDMVL